MIYQLHERWMSKSQTKIVDCLFIPLILFVSCRLNLLLGTFKKFLTFSQWIDSFTIIKQFSLSLWLEAYFGDQSWVFFGRTDAKAETPILWPPHAKSWLIGKDSDAGRDWGQEEKGMTEDEMAGCHHWLNGHESEWTLGVGDGQGGLACCDSWGHKESVTTEQLNWTELNQIHRWYSKLRNWRILRKWLLNRRGPIIKSYYLPTRVQGKRCNQQKKLCKND